MQGGINWLAGTGRPDLAAAYSIIPGGYKDMKPSFISDSNAAVKQAKTARVTLNIWAIPANRRRMVGFRDSSTDTSGNQRHQWGLPDRRDHSRTQQGATRASFVATVAVASAHPQGEQSHAV